MFDEAFSFDTPRSPSLDSSNTPSTRDTSRSVSPCSPVGPFPLPRFSVTDLAAQFADQRLRRDSRIVHDPCEAYAAIDDDAGWTVEPSIEEVVAMAPVAPSLSRRHSHRPARPHSPSQRSRRQTNARMLCTSAHRRDVAALVARMVHSNEQCSIVSPDSLTQVSTVSEDEGYDSSDGLTPVQSRRSSNATNAKWSESRRGSDHKSAGRCVSKSARFKRDGKTLSRARISDKA